jgi:N utilization substance protein B
MANRRKARELAMQVMYVWDAHGANDPEMARQAIAGAADADETARAEGLRMAEGAWGQREVSDQWVLRLAPQWPPRRQPPVDRNILRLGIWELTNAPTPPKVVIDEAVELAKQFSTENSPAFVNGVLDAVLRERKAMLGEETGTKARRHEGTEGLPDVP